MFKFFIERGADIDTRGIHGLTPVMLACLGGHANVVKAALRIGGRSVLQNQDDDGARVFHKAAVGGSNSVAEMLKAEGEICSEQV